MQQTPLTWEQLYSRYLDGALTADERLLFNAMLLNPARHGEVLSVMETQLKELPADYPEHLDPVKAQAIRDQIIEGARILPTTHRIHFLRSAWLRIAVAVILCVGIGTYLWDQNSKVKSENLKTASAKAVKTDIAPGYNRAVLTLSDGQQVALDSTTESITDGSISINNNNGQLIYESSKSINPLNSRDPRNPVSPRTNIMSTPRGGQYQLTLSDGTKVWLNAASSITYPAVFTSNTREVSITGEAYFDVKSNKSKPFIVKTKDDRIEVLGTEFNINAYPDEPATETSLFEGKVRINQTILHPMTSYSKGKVKKADLSSSAWKNGAFAFAEVSVPVMMRQLQRWYDIEVVYKGNIPANIMKGKIGRDLTLLQLMEVLRTAGIACKLEGRILTVL